MWEDFGKALTNVAFAGVGLAALAAEQVVKAGKVLAEKGEIYVEQGKRYGEELQQKLQEDAQRRREEQLEQRISAMDAQEREALRRRLAELDELERHTAAHTALLREASSQREPYPTQAQMEALARDVAEIRAILRQAGKRNEKRFSLPGIRLPRLRLPDIPWSSLLLGLAALALTGLVLWVVWSSLDTLWSAARGLLP